MENLNLILFISLVIPMSMMLLLFRGRSRIVCGFLLAGMFMCVFSGEINGLIAAAAGLDMQYVAVNIAPPVEEITKALPVILIAFLYKPEKQTLAEYALATGVGFATLENVCVFMSGGTISFAYAVLRALGAGMMHGICTLLVGIAMQSVTEKKIVYFSGTLASLCVAVIYHSIFNMLITSRFSVIGAMLPILTFAVIMASLSVFGRKKKENDAE